MNNHNPIDCVSIIFTHKKYIFAIQRQTNLPSFPGYLSFPEAQIDKDESPSKFETEFLSKYNTARMRTLDRKLFKELEYDIVEEIIKGEILSLTEIAEFLSPPFDAVSLRTWFYRIELKKCINFRANSDEFTKSFWKTATEMLKTYRDGKSLMAPPTRILLECLQRNPKAKALGDLSEKFERDKTIPCLEMIEGVKMYPVKSVTLPPASRTNAFLLGDFDSPKLIVDPSPSSMEEYQTLLDTIPCKKLNAIFLTHHHPDHHQFSNQLARQIKLPIILSHDTQKRLILKNGKDYFKNIELRNVVENDEVTRWHGSAVRVYEIPGHDAGHIGLAPDNMSWFIVGDLIQGIGTVVIPSPEGNMSAYYKTLEKVIALNPEVVIPSHGMPMRSTYRLKETLKHRYKRELQILDLYNSGKSQKEILKKLYEGIDPRLYSLALENIEAHLFKLRQEEQLVK